ncbi:MAG: acyl-CoA thioesterase [Deltaproteobacteria bacterium]|nr:acyl-CoA thioesterase [Deltaproteobacteria bacterium]
MFETNATIELHHTDAAGAVFFADYFVIAHSAYERYMESIGFALDQILTSSAFRLPIVHAEADYRRPVSLGGQLSILLRVDPGNSAFTASYDFKDARGEVVAILKTVHVCVDKKTGEKRPLPQDLREAFLEITS